MNVTNQARLPSWRAPLVLLLVLGAVLRLIDLTDPPLDFHATRQLRNSLVARAIYYDLSDQFSTEQRNLADSFRRSVGLYEPPVIETLAALAYILVGEDIAVARVLQTLVWVGAGLALFDLVRRLASISSALLALAYYLILPFSVQASRSFQPDPLMTAAFLGGLCFLFRWSEHQQWRWSLLAGLLFGLAALVKIVIAFLVGGAVIGVVLSLRPGRPWKWPQTWAMAGLMTLPAFTYYVIGTPGRSSEYFFAWTVTLIRLVLSPEFYARWLGFLGSLFGLSVLLLAAIGTMLAPARGRAMLIGVWIGYLLYGLTLPFQMVTHSYYHVQLIPIVALGLGLAAGPIIERAARQGRLWRFGIVAAILAAVAYQGWVARSLLLAEDHRHEPAFWIEVARAVPAQAPVIGLTQDYGYRLMYWGWRKVHLWPLSTDLTLARGGGREAPDEFLANTEGMDYFLVTAFGQLDKQPGLAGILNELPVAAQGEGYILYDLRR